MKIKTNQLKEVDGEEDFFHSVLRNAMGDDLPDDGELEVFFTINGKQYEPKVFNTLFENIKEFIRHKAKSILLDKLAISAKNAQVLGELILELSNDLSNDEG